MQGIALDGGPVRFTGALDFDRRPTGIVPRRLPSWTRPQVPLFMEITVTMPSGIRLEFATTSPHDRTRRAADTHRNREATRARRIRSGDRRQRRQKRRDRVRRPAEDRPRRPRQSDADPRRRRHCRIRRSTGRHEAMRTLVAGECDPRTAELAHRRRRTDRAAARAGAPPVGASRQLDQPLYGSVESDADVAGRRRPAGRRRTAERRARRQLPPRSVRCADDARSARRRDEPQGRHQRRERSTR